MTFRVPNQAVEACVYQLTFPNGKAYIGATRKTAEQRFAVHLSHARRLHARHAKAVHMAIAKYGPETVQVETLFTGDIDACFAFEKHAIVTLRTRAPHGYNLTEGGEGVRGIDALTRAKISAARMGNTDGKYRVITDELRAKLSGRVISADQRTKMNAGRRGVVHTAEARANMSAAQKGKIVSAEARAKISAAKKGRPQSAEHKAALRAARKGIVLSDEHKAKISAANKGRPLSDEHKAKIGASARARHAAMQKAAP